jgi:outer membrane immunogenic protein
MSCQRLAKRHTLIRENNAVADYKYREVASRTFPSTVIRPPQSGWSVPCKMTPRQIAAIGGGTMKKLWHAGFAVAALVAVPSAAADLKPVYKAKAPPVEVLTWTGFYVGGNVGYSWGRSSNDWSFNAFPATPFAGSTICEPTGGAFCAAGSDSGRLNGVIGGLQAGYNWQQANYLIGVETDIHASGQKGDQIFTAAYPFNAAGTILNGNVTAPYSERLMWLGTLRGRVGYATDRWLLYATGGLAYGRVTINGSATTTGVAGNPGCVDFNIVAANCALASFSNGVTKAGWTLGFGAEGRIAGNWSWKLEYLHVDLGRVSTAFATLPGCFGGFVLFGGGGGAAACIPYAPGSGTISSRITDEIVRVGINYHFAPGPLVANY